MSTRRESWLRGCAARVRGFLSGRGHEGEFDDEVREHLQLLAARFVAQGMSEEEAAAAARRQFGNTTLLQEDRRDLQTFLSLEELWHDLRYGFRMLGKNPGFTAVAVLTLALGIGANTAVFSVVNGVLLRPLAYHEPNQLCLIQVVWAQMSKFYPMIPANFSGYQIWRKQCHSFEDIAIAEGASADLTGPGEPVEIHGVWGSANLFALLGVAPALGRDFLPMEDESGRGRVVVLTNRLWRGYFH